jgi:hypothetical protein
MKSQEPILYCWFSRVRLTANHPDALRVDLQSSVVQKNVALHVNVTMFCHIALKLKKVEKANGFTKTTLHQLRSTLAKNQFHPQDIKLVLLILRPLAETVQTTFRFVNLLELILPPVNHEKFV